MLRIFSHKLFSSHTLKIYISFSTLLIVHVDIVSVSISTNCIAGLLTTISLPCYYDGKFFGVVGTDLSMEDLLSEITYFREGQASYAFIADSSGRTMMHPLLPAPSNADDKPIFMDIRDLEPDPTFNSVVFDSMKRCVI